MGTFILKKRMDLSEFGEDWKDCYIELRDPTLGEVQEMGKVDRENAVRVMGEIMERCFLSGKAFDGQSVVDVKKEQLKDLPNEIYQGVMDFFTMGSSRVKKD